MSNIISTILFCSSYLWITFQVVHRTTGKVIFYIQLPSWSWDTSLAIIIITALAIKLIIYWAISLFEVLEWFYYNTACTLSRFSCVQLFATLWTVSPPRSSVHGILQARILEWVAMPSSSESSWPRDQTCLSYVSCIGRRVFFTTSTVIISWYKQIIIPFCRWIEGHYK